MCLAASLVLAGCGATSSDPGRATPRGAGPAGRNSPSERAAEGAAGAAADRSVGIVAASLGAAAAAEDACRPGMVSIEGSYCIDRYEASLVETLPSGEERPFSPFSTLADQHVRAVSEPHVYPQGYISAKQADRACRASGKRLCRVAEWQQACRGPANNRYGYADEREPGKCNDKGQNPVVRLFGFRYDASTMNRPQLNQLPGTLSKTGEHSGCSNGYGVYDMVGNLHEWVADPKGAFYGGYYQDVGSVGHGHGCGYKTTAHEARYHDYSTGFRCCADPLGAEVAVPVSSLAEATPKAGKTRRVPRKPKATKATKAQPKASKPPRARQKRPGKRR